MADYTYQELMRMQNDAVKRVEDMQRRARKAAGIDEGNNKEPSQNTPANREPHHIPQPQGYLPKPEKNEAPQSQREVGNMTFLDGIKKNFDKIDIDEDKALILSLLLLLSGENGDEALLTALIYMLT